MVLQLTLLMMMCCPQAYGSAAYLSTTLRRVQRGTEGAVSVEGTLAGLAAAIGFTGLGVGLQLVSKDFKTLISI